MCYSKEHKDILTRGLWTSDPVLHYESNVLQTFRPCNIRISKKKQDMFGRAGDTAREELEEVNIQKLDSDNIYEVEDEFYN